MASFLDRLLRFEEPFGDTNFRKEKLREVSDSLKEKLEEKLSDLKIDSTDLAKKALVVGGSVAAVYLLLELILPDDDNESSQRTMSTQNVPIVIERKNESSWITKTVQTFIITSLLEIARQQLMSYLESQNEPNANQNTSSTSTT